MSSLVFTTKEIRDTKIITPKMMKQNKNSICHCQTKERYRRINALYGFISPSSPMIGADHTIPKVNVVTAEMIFGLVTSSLH